MLLHARKPKHIQRKIITKTIKSKLIPISFVSFMLFLKCVSEPQYGQIFGGRFVMVFHSTFL